ncbi:MAG: hypothetical protein IOD12_08145 [Silvanigrellales bacterium]|jgi:hypothetical protein|nr:hypothetical protein [Silvanigrellales bacterium]
MKAGRCPYHVRQGIVDTEGKLVLSDVCGVKAAAGSSCGHAPFEDACFKTCQRFQAQSRGGERQVLIPKNDIEYLPELGGLSSFSEMELM